MIIKILSDDNSARYSDLIEAIKYAENMGADICNLSIATNTANQTLYKTMKESKMLFVVAAGNDGLEIGHECNVYPAMYNLENTITVGSVDEKGAVSQFSNYSRKYVDIVAIGENLRAKDSSGNWIQYYGTTYSTAFVSAKAAYIMEKYETRNPKETKELIISKTTQHELLKEYVRYGSIE